MPSPNLGKAILAARKSVGISQEELARRIGTRAGVISRWERGLHMPRMTHLEAIASATDTPPRVFLDAIALDLEAGS
jgi:transcriptional regulator with XRE-family HTH domain